MITWRLGTDIYSATASEKKMGKEGEEEEEERYGIVILLSIHHPCLPLLRILEVPIYHF